MRPWRTGRKCRDATAADAGLGNDDFVARATTSGWPSPGASGLVWSSAGRDGRGDGSTSDSSGFEGPPGDGQHWARSAAGWAPACAARPLCSRRAVSLECWRLTPSNRDRESRGASDDGYGSWAGSGEGGVESVPFDWVRTLRAASMMVLLRVRFACVHRPAACASFPLLQPRLALAWAFDSSGRLLSCPVLSWASVPPPQFRAGFGSLQLVGVMTSLGQGPGDRCHPLAGVSEPLPRR